MCLSPCRVLRLSVDVGQPNVLAAGENGGGGRSKLS